MFSYVMFYRVAFYYVEWGGGARLTQKRTTRALRSLFTFEAFRAASGTSEEILDKRRFQKLGFSCSRWNEWLFSRSIFDQIWPKKSSMFFWPNFQFRVCSRQRPGTQEEPNGCTKSLQFDFPENKPKRIETRKASTGCTKSLKSDFPTRALSEPSSESRRAGRGPRRIQNGPRERFGHFSLQLNRSRTQSIEIIRISKTLIQPLDTSNSIVRDKNNAHNMRPNRTYDTEY